MRKFTLGGAAALLAVVMTVWTPGAHASVSQGADYVSGPVGDLDIVCRDKAGPAPHPSFDVGGVCVYGLPPAGTPVSFRVIDVTGRPQQGLAAFGDGAGAILPGYAGYCNGTGTVVVPARAAMLYVIVDSVSHSVPTLGACQPGSQGPATKGTVVVTW
ncbi:MAG: hypothetical protein QOI20_499 [Acidimicrobiaceae bacterium]|jgi:hypothetical protein|nr:hypothetical protein [Acidimicrobiaceae bacterium]